MKRFFTSFSKTLLLSCKGISITELLVSVTLAGVVFSGLMNQYLQSTRTSHDQAVRTSNNLKAQAVLQTIISELRILGNGVPFDQANFQIGELTLSDQTVTEPISIANTTANQIAFRLNESGDVHLLTQAFDPATSLSITLTDVTSLDVNDPIYISDSVVSGDDGLYGTVTGVNTGSKTITISATYVTRPGATFAVGSILEEVPLVTISSAADGTGITRDSGFGPLLLAENSTMELEYLDENQNVLALPLTHDMLVNQLRAIRVSISVNSTDTLRSGENYQTQASAIVGLRNLNYLY